MFLILPAALVRGTVDFYQMQKFYLLSEFHAVTQKTFTI
jgi:hypothetical protein